MAWVSTLQDPEITHLQHDPTSKSATGCNLRGTGVLQVNPLISSESQFAFQSGEIRLRPRGLAPAGFQGVEGVKWRRDLPPGASSSPHFCSPQTQSLHARLLGEGQASEAHGGRTGTRD